MGFARTIVGLVGLCGLSSIGSAMTLNALIEELSGKSSGVSVKYNTSRPATIEGSERVYAGRDCTLGDICNDYYRLEQCNFRINQDDELKIKGFLLYPQEKGLQVVLLLSDVYPKSGKNRFNNKLNLIFPYSMLAAKDSNYEFELPFTQKLYLRDTLEFKSPGTCLPMTP